MEIKTSGHRYTIILYRVINNLNDNIIRWRSLMREFLISYTAKCSHFCTDVQRNCGGLFLICFSYGQMFAFSHSCSTQLWGVFLICFSYGQNFRYFALQFALARHYLVFVRAFFWSLSLFLHTFLTFFCCFRSFFALFSHFFCHFRSFFALFSHLFVEM